MYILNNIYCMSEYLYIHNIVYTHTYNKTFILDAINRN